MRSTMGAGASVLGLVQESNTSQSVWFRNSFAIVTDYFLCWHLSEAVDEKDGFNG